MRQAPMPGRIESLPIGLAQDLDASVSADAGVSLSNLLTHADVLDRLRQWCRRALAESHLVSVASVLVRRFGADLDALDRLELPSDILTEFPEWRAGSRRGFRPGASGFRPSPAGAAEPIGTLRIQLSPAPGTVPYAFALLRDLVRTLDRDVCFVVVVEPTADLDALNRVVSEFFAAGSVSRVRFVPLSCVSVFAQDNARAALDRDGRPILLVPRIFRRGSARAEDEMTPEDAARVFGLPVHRSRLHWDGGNIVHDAHGCFVGVDTIAENMTRLGLTSQETIALFSAELGMPVTPLGDLRAARFDHEKCVMAESGQAAFHIDLDVALLGRLGRGRRPRALVSDAARGMDYLPAVLSRTSLFTGRFLPARDAREYIRAEYDAHARMRHPRLLDYAATLESVGYRVFGLPSVSIDPMENVFASINLDFGYCNVLPGLHRGTPAVHYLPWGIRALDAAAAARMRSAGVKPVRISRAAIANALMRLQGGLHCFCGPLRAGLSDQ
jgi:hypothetical protein